MDRPAGPLNQKDCQKYVERMKNNKHAVPEELSFDKVINNETLPVSRRSALPVSHTNAITQPCSLQDFMDYLVYIAHDAENLQFYLWLKDYTKRYNQLKKEDQALSPEWKSAVPEDNTNRRQNADDAGIDLEKMHKPSYATLRMSELSSGRDTPAINDYQSFISNSVRSQKTVAEAAEDAVTGVGLKWQPCLYSLAFHVIKTNRR